MAKIDELVKQVKDELLDKEMNLDDLDNRIKEIFKTKNSVFDAIKDWVISTEDGLKVQYNFTAKSNYRIYITLQVCNGEKQMMLKNMKVKLIKIIKISGV